ncbi:MAG TPA: hypothetical protein VFN74_10240 [Chloroflexota bacterium]|nr:hypothetical protein [Chloroflexota bacterium]
MDGRQRRALRLSYAWTLRDRTVAIGAVVLTFVTVALLVKGP